MKKRFLTKDEYNNLSEENKKRYNKWVAKVEKKRERKGKIRQLWVNGFHARNVWKKEKCACGKKANFFYRELWICNRCLRGKREFRYVDRPKPPKLSYAYKKLTVTARVMEQRKKATSAEMVFKKKLKKFDIKSKHQRAFIKGDYYAIVDFHIPSRNICIEIDGGYHTDAKQASKDAYRDKWLTEVRKQKVVRFTNEEAFTLQPVEIQSKIQEVTGKLLPLK